jgi:hypothetical protein
MCTLFLPLHNFDTSIHNLRFQVHAPAVHELGTSNCVFINMHGTNTNFDYCFSVHVVKVHNLRYQLHAPVLLIRKVQDYIDLLHSRH